MPAIRLVPLDRPDVPPRTLSPRLRSQLVYFASAPDAAGVPPLGEAEYYFAAAEVAKYLDDGVLYLVSPLDTDNMTEVELSEEQEALLEWLRAGGVQHAKVVE
jgi:hypothetical protein